MSRRKVAAVVLAAGRSTRAGTVNKLLMPFGDTTLLGCVLKHLRRSRVDEIIVVTGYQAGRVAPVAAAALTGAGKSWRIVKAKDYEKGLSASLKTGIAALSPRTAGALVVLGDMPLIMPQVIDGLLKAFQLGNAAVVPVRNGKWGNPVLLSRMLFPKIRQMTGDQGAKPILKRLKGGVRFLETGDPAIEMDVDRPGDLEGIREK